MTTLLNSQTSCAKIVNIADAKIGLFSSNPNLMTSAEYFEGVRHPACSKGSAWQLQSQHANFNIKMSDYDARLPLDGTMTIIDHPGIEPRIAANGSALVASGDWTALEKKSLDKRYTLLGNQGLFLRFALTVLERQKGVHTFHAAGLIDNDSERCYLVLGERGSGKSAFLLSALDTGRFKTFGSEMIHACFRGNSLTFIRGSLRNNIRLGHLLYDFPNIQSNLGLGFQEVDEPWNLKLMIHLGEYNTDKELIHNPELVVVIPRIEENLPRAIITPVSAPMETERSLFENISDKIAMSTLIYETIPIESMDDPQLSSARKAFVERFLRNPKLVKIVKVFGSPRNCLEALDSS